jgi:Domain of Unknown Function (DUF1080)
LPPRADNLRGHEICRHYILPHPLAGKKRRAGSDHANSSHRAFQRQGFSRLDVLHEKRRRPAADLERDQRRYSIHCTGNPSGYIRTKDNYSNYVLDVEWRFVKISPKADNTGVLVQIQPPDKVWPRCIQNQGKSGRQGDLFVMSGAECKEHLALGRDANTPVARRGEPNENPVGEWNTNVTVCAGDNVKAIINGKLLNEITECTVLSGFIGIQSEGGDIEIRRMDLEPLK